MGPGFRFEQVVSSTCVEVAEEVCFALSLNGWDVIYPATNDVACQLDISEGGKGCAHVCDGLRRLRDGIVREGGVVRSPTGWYVYLYALDWAAMGWV